MICNLWGNLSLSKIIGGGTPHRCILLFCKIVYIISILWVGGGEGGEGEGVGVGDHGALFAKITLCHNRSTQIS